MNDSDSRARRELTTPGRLACILHEEGLPAEILALAHEDLSLLSDNALRSYARMIADDITREAGSVPFDETAEILCVHCGPAWAAPEVAALLPQVRGWKAALGCPWCHVAANGVNVPRPEVSCGPCQFFRRDPLNPFSGAGVCAKNVWQQQMYPGSVHTCRTFRPVEKAP